MAALYLSRTIRRIETAWIGVLPEGTLMRRAAAAVAASAERVARTLPRATPIVALVGPGNNGGDALLALWREAGPEGLEGLGGGGRGEAGGARPLHVGEQIAAHEPRLDTRDATRPSSMTAATSSE